MYIRGMETPDPVEVTTRYATSVDDLPSAWAFVMEKIDHVGPAPSIEIQPYWELEDDSRRFSVVVSGTIEDGHDAQN